MTTDMTKLESLVNMAAKWEYICALAGYDYQHADTLTPTTVAIALKTHGFKLPKQYENVTMPDCDGNGGGWCNCPECED